MKNSRDSNQCERQKLNGPISKVSGLIRSILFTDVTPLIRLGRTRPLESGDLPAMPAFHNRQSVSRRFATLAPIAVPVGVKASRLDVLRFLMDVIWRVRWPVLGMFLLSIGLIVCELLGPVFMNRLLTHLASPSASWPNSAPATNQLVASTEVIQ